MNEQQDRDKGILKDRLGDYRVDPPAHVWASISARLGRGSRRKMILISLSVAATIALAVLLGINFLQWDPFGPMETARTERGSGIEDGGSPGDRYTPTGTPASPEPASPEPADRPGAVAGPQEAAAHVEASVDLAEKAGIRPEDVGIRTEEAVALSDEAGARTDEPGAPSEHLARAEKSETDESIEGTILIAQEELQLDVPSGSEQENRDPRWIVGAALSPIYSYRDAEEQLLAVSSDYERGIISYAGGIHVSYRTGERLAIESGVLFNKMGIAISAPGVQVFKQSFDFAPLRDETGSSNILAVSNSMGNIVSQSGDIYVNSYKANQFYELNSSAVADEVYADQGIRQNFDYLELPFNVRYSVIKRDLEVQLVGGMSTNFLLNSNVTMPTTEGNLEIGYLTNLKTVNYSGNAGVGMIYHLQEHFSLRLEPRFRYFLNSINDQTLPVTRPFTFGIYTGLNYRF